METLTETDVELRRDSDCEIRPNIYCINDDKRHKQLYNYYIMYTYHSNGVYIPYNIYIYICMNKLTSAQLLLLQIGLQL